MASSSASRVSKYDVFLSFRGPDTRHSIVSHLYEALKSRGIRTFKDNYRLHIGDHISDELQRAIQGSDFAVVLLSETYATSRWCLVELQLIMELHMKERLAVVPVFYKVEPASVRYQKGSFDLKRYQRPEDADKVLKWRKALKSIADLKGYESDQCFDEATMVREIAEDILKRKSLMHNTEWTKVVGVDTHMQDLKSLLDVDSKNDEVRMIGIWGMGGIGKTEIAKCLYYQLTSQFTTSCFAENLKGIDEDCDLLPLQKKLLLDLTLDNDINLWSVEAGRKVIAARLRNHKVLLVLDGVDKLNQIHALAKETTWFGGGSRIIITTRDEGLLKSCGVERVYKVKCMDDEDSLQMFKQIAFVGGSPPSVDFEQLSIRAARLAHGLPSALKSYALYLRGRTKSPEEWEEALCGLEISPVEDIMKILKISYECLTKPLQNDFLQVACLFNGDPLQHVLSLLDGFKPKEKKHRIQVLEEKSLIDTTNGHVILHKLVEQMGREIMTDSGKFLGDPKKIYEALVKQEFPPLTECISLHTCEIANATFANNLAFGSMSNLKFLKVYKHVDNSESRLHFTPERHFLSKSHTLRLLHWDAFPLRTLPYPFYKYFIVELSLRHSNLETLWNEPTEFENLKKLDVTGSYNLKRLPDLSYSKELDELILEECPSLKRIPESIGKGSTLGKLNLSYYGGPKRPMGVVMHKVEYGRQRFTLEFTTAKVDMQLMNVSITGDIKFRVFADCEGYAKYFSFSSGPSGRQIHIRRFSYKEDDRPITFRRFPHIPGLNELNLVNLNIQKLSYGIGHLEFLEKLDFSGNDFENLPEDMNRLSRLKTLWLRNCSKLKGLPELTQVQSLTLSNCRNLISLVKLSDASQRYCLLELCLDNCKNVKSLSDQLSHFNKLTYLDLSSHDFETLPSSVGDLTSLVTLCLNNCKELKSVEEIPVSVQFLDVQGCDSLAADAFKHFKGRLKKEVPVQPHSSCFQETEKLSYESDYQAKKSLKSAEELPMSLQFLETQGCDSLDADTFEHFKGRRNKEVPAQPGRTCFQETEMPSYERDHQAKKSRLPKFLRCSYF